MFEFMDEKPEIDETAYVDETAVVSGAVKLAANASVFPTAVLRGDEGAIAVGKNTNIQDGAILHCAHGFNCTVGAGVTVGHRAIVHGCTVGDNSLIGMGATILNGAMIGSDCIVGAGALVTEGMKIPDGMLAVGVPAKVIKPVTEEQKAWIRANASEYAILAGKYLLRQRSGSR